MIKTVKLGSRIAKEEKVILDKLTNDLNMGQGEVIGYLLRSYKESNPESALSLKSFDLSATEQDEVQKALVNSKSELDVVAKDGLLQRSRYLNSVADRQVALESMSDEEIKKATFKGAASFKIEQAVNTIISHNNNQPEKSDKVCITKGIIFKLTGSNRQTINKWFDNHHIMIDDHNQKHELTDADNRKGKGFSFQELLGV